MSKKVSKKAEFLLFNLLAITHRDVAFVDWVQDQSRDTNLAVQELIDAGLIEIDSPEPTPTREGRAYFKSDDTEVKEVLQQIKNIVGKNPSFKHICSNLTDTALVRLIYTALGEIGYRGDPDNLPKWKMWNEKIKDLEKVIVGADPNTLLEQYTTIKN